MASFIVKQPKDTKEQTTVSLSGTALADLELYCHFIDSARDWVINEALKSVFRRDEAFLEWKEHAGTEDQTKPGEACRRLSVRVPQLSLDMGNRSVAASPSRSFRTVPPTLHGVPAPSCSK